MAKEGINKEFEELIRKKYLYYCKRRGLEHSSAGLIDYMIQHNVIPQARINRYMVIEQYPEAFYKSPSKTQAVLFLEAETGVCERSVWNYLVNQKYFQPSAT